MQHTRLCHPQSLSTQSAQQEAYKAWALSGLAFNSTYGQKQSNTHLTSDIAVGETHYKTVLGGVIFVFVLDSQAFTGEVVGLSFTTPLELNLVPLEVLLVLDYLDEPLKSNEIVE